MNFLHIKGLTGKFAQPIITSLSQLQIGSESPEKNALSQFRHFMNSPKPHEKFLSAIAHMKKERVSVKSNVVNTPENKNLGTNIRVSKTVPVTTDIPSVKENAQVVSDLLAKASRGIADTIKKSTKPRDVIKQGLVAHLPVTTDIPSVKENAQVVSDLLAKASRGIADTIKKSTKPRDVIEQVPVAHQFPIASFLGKINTPDSISEVIREVADQILVSSTSLSSGQEVRITINQSVLPQTEVKISQNPDGKIKVEFVSTSAESATWLQNNLKQLEQVIGPDKVSISLVKIDDTGGKSPVEITSQAEEISSRLTPSTEQNIRTETRTDLGQQSTIAKVATTEGVKAEQLQKSSTEEENNQGRSRGIFLFEDLEENAT